MVKIGEKLQGITEYYCYRKRAEIINTIRLGEDSQQIVKGRKKLFTFKNVYDDYIVWAKGNKSSWSRNEQLFRIHMKSLHDYNLIDLKHEKLNTFSTFSRIYVGSCKADY